MTNSENKCNDREDNESLKNETNVTVSQKANPIKQLVVVSSEISRIIKTSQKSSQRLKLCYKYYKENQSKFLLSFVVLNVNTERMLNLSGVRIQNNNQKMLPTNKPHPKPIASGSNTHCINVNTIERKKSSHNNLVINVRSVKGFDNQETIIEECKNSLNELIKASKWPEKAKLKDQSELDTMHLDQIPDMDMSQSSLATSSLSLNYSVNEASGANCNLPKSSRPILNMLQPSNTDLVFKNKLFEVKNKTQTQTKAISGLSNIFAAPKSSTMLTGLENTSANQNNLKSDFVRNRYDNYDNYNEFSKSNTTLTYKDPEISSPASNLVGGASQFNSKFFQLKKSQSVANGQLSSLNLISKWRGFLLIHNIYLFKNRS